MRQRQFRGISYDGQSIFGTSLIQRKDWVGDIWVSRVFLLNGDACNHTPETSAFVEVKPNTVGDWTGIKDKDDQDIYEGDIVQWEEDFDDGPRTCRCAISWIPECASFVLPADNLEVIGNIYANPELLAK